MFITKIIKSKKISCLLKLNISASTLYYTQAMEGKQQAFNNGQQAEEDKSQSTLTDIENGEIKFISTKRSNKKKSKKDSINQLKKSLNKTNNDKVIIDTHEDNNSFSKNDNNNASLDNGNEIYSSMELDEEKEDNKYKNTNDINNTIEKNKTDQTKKEGKSILYKTDINELFKEFENININI